MFEQLYLCKAEQAVLVYYIFASQNPYLHKRVQFFSPIEKSKLCSPSAVVILIYRSASMAKITSKNIDFIEEVKLDPQELIWFAIKANDKTEVEWISEQNIAWQTLKSQKLLTFYSRQNKNIKSINGLKFYLQKQTMIQHKHKKK